MTRAGVCLFAVGCLLSAVLPAAAADLPVKAPNIAMLNWTGVYVGANGGWARAGRVDGAEAGGQIGINYQVGRIVFGAEGDLEWTDVSATGSLAGALVTEKMKLRYFGTARGRVGFTFDRALVYGTGGLAFSNNKHEGTGIGPLAGTYNTSNTVAGWTAGGGVEWMLPDPHWSAKVEYLYAHFGSYSNFYTSLALPFTVNYTAFHMNIVRAGLNYRF